MRRKLIRSALSAFAIYGCIIQWPLLMAGIIKGWVAVVCLILGLAASGKAMQMGDEEIPIGPRPETDPAQDLIELIGTDVHIVLNGVAMEVFVTEVMDGQVVYLVRDEEGNDKSWDNLSYEAFRSVMVHTKE